MSWDKLPTELKVYILRLRYNLQNISVNKAAIIIQKFWRRIDIQYKTISSLIPKPYSIIYYPYGWVNLEDPNLAKFLKFCNLFDILKLQKYIPLWMTLRDDIEDQIMKDTLCGESLGDSINYNTIYNYYSILCNKINNNNNIRLYY